MYLSPIAPNDPSLTMSPLYYDIDITTFVVDILEVAFSLLSPGQGAIQKEKRKKFVEDDEEQTERIVESGVQHEVEFSTKEPTASFYDNERS